MRPFTFHPGPRLLAGPDHAVALAEKLPLGSRACSSPTRELTALAWPTRAYQDAIGADRPSRPVRRGRGRSVEGYACSPRPTRAARQNVTQSSAFGGGSPMDVAKLAAYLLGSGDDLDEIWGVGLAKGQRLPLALVPTTAGTGSEATPISVITCEGGVKLAVNAPPLIADWAVLDATLTLGLASPRHGRNRNRRDRPCCRSLHVGAAQEPAIGRVGAGGAAIAERQSADRHSTSRAISKRARRCCSARIWPAWLLPMRRSPAFMRWHIRSADFIICRTGSAMR